MTTESGWEPKTLLIGFAFVILAGFIFWVLPDLVGPQNNRQTQVDINPARCGHANGCHEAGADSHRQSQDHRRAGRSTCRNLSSQTHRTRRFGPCTLGPKRPCSNQPRGDGG